MDNVVKESDPSTFGVDDGSCLSL